MTKKKGKYPRRSLDLVEALIKVDLYNIEKSIII